MRREFPTGTLAIATAHSINEKIGKAATTYAAQQSCPTDCVFFDGGGCYAEDGPLGKFVTQPLNRSAALVKNIGLIEIARAEAAAIDALPDHEIQDLPLRLHTVGDCATDEAARIVAAAAERYRERGGGPVWTYTHAWRIVCREAWGQSVNVLASCEGAGDVVLAHSRGYATAMVVEDFESEKLYSVVSKDYSERSNSSTADTGKGVPAFRPDDGVTRPEASGETRPPSESACVKLLPCPAQTRNVPCSACGLCMNGERLLNEGMTIGFAIHGTQLLRRKARLALHDPANPDRKLTSRVLIPRFIESYRAEHGREPTQREIADGLDLNPSSVWEMMKSLRTGKPTVKKRHRRPKAKA